MASADWLKCTTQKAGALKKHFGQEEREKGNHSNPDIDKSRSYLNYCIGCSDYSQALEEMKKRTKEVDKVKPPKRVRKDRVTCCMIEIPCPNAIAEQGQSDSFFLKAFETMKQFFGTKNVHGGFVHKDEVHSYIDKNGETRKSLEHMHTLVSAYTEEKGINGKTFETRARLRAFNKIMDEMCRKEFGIPFNTGETPDKKSVERLKQETELRREADTLKSEINELKQQADSAEQRVATAQQQAEQIDEELQPLRDELQEYTDIKRDFRELEPKTMKIPLAKKVIVSTSDLQEVKNQAKSYRAVRKQLKSIEDREVAITDRETAIREREDKLTEREQTCRSQEQAFRDIQQALETAERELSAEKEKASQYQSALESTKDERDKLAKKHETLLNDLGKNCTAMKDFAVALKTLISENSPYKANLNEQQTALLKSIISITERLLRGQMEENNPTYRIFQIKNGAEGRDVRFEDIASLEKRGLKPDFRNYEQVYEAPLTDVTSVSDILPEQLEYLFQKFNTDAPDGYNGRSMSVSDVIILDKTPYFVDRVGFRKMRNFTPEQLETLKGLESPQKAEIPELILKEMKKFMPPDQPLFSIERISSDEFKPTSGSDSDTPHRNTYRGR